MNFRVPIDSAWSNEHRRCSMSLGSLESDGCEVSSGETITALGVVTRGFFARGLPKVRLCV